MPAFFELCGEGVAVAFRNELDVWVLDPVMGNRMLLAAWVRSEADNLDMRFRLHALADAGELCAVPRGLILASGVISASHALSLLSPDSSGLPVSPNSSDSSDSSDSPDSAGPAGSLDSPELSEPPRQRMSPRMSGSQYAPGMPDAPNEQGTQSVQGVLCVYGCSETDCGVHVRLSEPPVHLPWPVPRRMLRRLMAAAVVMAARMAPAVSVGSAVPVGPDGAIGPVGPDVSVELVGPIGPIGPIGQVGQAGVKDGPGESGTQVAEVAPALFGHPLPAELGDFSGRLRQALQELHDGCDAALQEEDCPKGERTAHTLKGTAMSFGQLVLAEAADALQDAFAAEDMAEAAWWLRVVGRLCGAGEVAA